MSAGEKGIGAITAIGICIALALTTAGAGAVVATSGIHVNGQIIQITPPMVEEYCDNNDITMEDVNNLSITNSLRFFIEVAKVEMNKSTYEPVPYEIPDYIKAAMNK